VLTITVMAVTTVAGAAFPSDHPDARPRVAVTVAAVRTEPAMPRPIPRDPCCPPTADPCDPALVCPDRPDVPIPGRRFATGIAVMIPLRIAPWAAFFLFAWWLLF
jgi:hypothetical protein